MHSCKSVMYIGRDALESLFHHVADNSPMADAFLEENWKDEEDEEEKGVVVVDNHKDESGGS